MYTCMYIYQHLNALVYTLSSSFFIFFFIFCILHRLLCLVLNHEIHIIGLTVYDVYSYKVLVTLDIYILIARIQFHKCRPTTLRK